MSIFERKLNNLDFFFKSQNQTTHNLMEQQPKQESMQDMMEESENQFRA